MRAPKRKTKMYWSYAFSWLPTIQRQELRWKDKFNTPRCEIVPFLRIEWLYWGLYQSIGEDEYWEQWLWIHKYCDGDEALAKTSWPWRDMDSETSSWIDY